MRSGALWSGSPCTRDAGAWCRAVPPCPRVPASRGRPVPPRADGAVAGVLGASALVERAGTYAELSKFGIVLLVLVSAAAGFMLRAPLGADFPLAHGLVVLLGVMLLSSGASALNQVQERDRDALMARTARRPLPSGRISHAQGLIFAMVATAAGAVVLWGGIWRTAGLLGLIGAVLSHAAETTGRDTGLHPPGDRVGGRGRRAHGCRCHHPLRHPLSLADAALLGPRPSLPGGLRVGRLPHGERRGRRRGDGAADPALCLGPDRVVTGRADLRGGRAALLRPRRPPRRAAYWASPRRRRPTARYAA